MIRITCPHCKTKADLADEEVGQVHRCEECSKAIRVPAAKATAVTTTAPEPAKKGKQTWDEFAAASAAYQGEVKKLEESLPDLDGMPADPLPDSAENCGKVVATLGLDKAPAVGKVVGGIAMLGLGVILLMLAGLYVLSTGRIGGAIFGGLIGGGIGAMFSGIGMLVKRSVKQGIVLWICTKGLVWQIKNKVDSCRWKEMEGISLTEENGSSAYAITLRGERVMVVATISEHALDFGEYVERKAAIALLPESMKELYQGKTVSFGSIAVNRGGIVWGKKSCRWSEVVKVKLDEENVIVDKQAKAKFMAAPLAEVAHRLVLTAAARIILKDGLGKDSMELPVDDEAANDDDEPFNF